MSFRTFKARALGSSPSRLTIHNQSLPRIAALATPLKLGPCAAEAFGQTYVRLPLEQSPHIIQDNALRFDWRSVLPPDQCNSLLGNPPFIGKQYRSTEHQADMELVWDGVRSAGVLDYVTCWYRRAAEYIIHTNVRVAEAEEDQTLDPTSRDNLLRRALHSSRTAS